MVCQFYLSFQGNGTPLQCSCLENPVDGGAWWAAVHGVAKSRTRLSDFTFTFHFLALEKEMATYSIVLAWRIPGTGKPGGLPSMGSHRVRHDWSNLAAAAAAAAAWTIRELRVSCYFYEFFFTHISLPWQLNSYYILKWKKVKSLSCVWLFVTPWTVAYQVPPSMGFSRQEY